MKKYRQKLKIAHVVDYLMPTMGYQEFLLPKWNAKHGHKVHIFTSDRYYPVPDYEHTWGKLLGPRNCGSGTDIVDNVTICRLPCQWELRRRPWLKGLEREIHRFSPDVIFCHGTGSPNSIRLVFFAKKHGVPLLMDNHMVFSVQNGSLAGHLYYLGLRFVSRRLYNNNVYRFLGVAQECCDFLRDSQGIDEEKIVTLPLAVDTDLFFPNEDLGKKAREKYGIPSNAKIVLQTGKLSPNKGPDILAKAMVPIMQKDANVWLVYVGAGPKDYLNVIYSIIDCHEVLDQFKIIPMVQASELVSIYNMSDICVYPKGCSLSSLEAAACGCAVIMTDLPASQWRAKHGVGICYTTGNYRELTSIIDDLVQDPKKRDNIANAASMAILEHFSYDAISKKSEMLMFQSIAEMQKAGVCAV